MNAFRKTCAAVVLAGTAWFGLADGAKAQQYNWTGLYLGGHVGIAATDADWTFFNGAVTETFRQDSSGWSGGAHLGLQQQMGNFVIGAEVSWSRLNHEDTSTALLAPNRSRTSEIDDLFLATVRLGVTFNQWLPYVKGGYANGDVSYRTFVTSSGQPTTQSSGREHGWTVGAGLEYAMTPNLILGVEYDYVRLNVDNRSQYVFPGFISPETVTNASADIHSVMARLSYKLGDHGEYRPLK